MSEATKMYDRLAEVYGEAVQTSAKLTELAVDLQAAGCQASAERYAGLALRSSVLASGLWDALLRAQADVLTEPEPVGAEQPLRSHQPHRKTPVTNTFQSRGAVAAPGETHEERTGNDSEDCNEGLDGSEQ